jgi:outer membrane lipoprotein SlyB
MRPSNRFATIAAGASLAALLAGCAAPYSNQPVSGYPSSPYPTSSTTYPSTTYPSTTYPSTTYPSAQTSNSGQVAQEFGRVTDIQTVSMGATSATNPNVRNAVVGGIIGAVVGNVIGKNVNSGDNRSGVTVLGGAAGAAIGSGMGRNNPNTASSGAGGPAYRVSIQTDQGQMRTYEVGATGDLRVGDRVRVENGVIYRS